MFNREIPKTKFNRLLLDEIREMAEPYLTTAPESLPYSLFVQFREIGERGEYEAKYFDHRRRLNCLFFAYLDTKDEKYLLPLWDALFAILDEYTWAVPAHVSDRTPLTITTKIDLFSAETVYALAEIDHILGDTIPSLIRERIRIEVERRFISSFFAGTGRYIKNNWSAVQSAGIIAGLVYLFPQRLDEALPTLLPIMENFLNSYNEDGCCMEGSLYWIYGFGFYCYGANMLREATDGKINLFTSQKVANIAHYFEHITFKNGYVIPFADTSLRCKVRMGLSVFLHHEFGAAYPDSTLLTSIADDTRFRFADLLHDLYWSEDFDTAGQAMADEYFWEDSQWYICRGEGLSFCGKGGHNQEPHNHCDVGNFAIFDGEKTVLGDLGWEDYTRDYFGPLRYTNFILTPSTGHAVPMIDGKTQTVVDKKATILTAKDGEFVLDIGSAYGIDSFLRSMKLSGDTFTVTDTCDLPFAERLVSGFVPALRDGALIIETLRVEFSVPCDIEITSDTYRPRRIICAEDLKEIETAYFVTIIPKTPTKTLTMRFVKEG